MIGTVTSGNQTWEVSNLLKEDLSWKVYKLVVYHIVCFI